MSRGFAQLGDKKEKEGWCLKSRCRTSRWSMRVQNSVCSGVSVCLHHHLAFSYCLSLKMDFKKVIFGQLFCPWAFLLPVKDKTWTWQTQSRALIPFGQFWVPFIVPFTQVQSKDPQCPQAVDLWSSWLPWPWDWVGVFTLSHSFNYSLFNWAQWGKGNAFNSF